MNDDGLPVKKPKGKSAVTVDILSNDVKVENPSISKLKEQFDLDRVEKELLEIDKQEGFLKKLFNTYSDERAIKHLKSKTEALELRRRLRQEIIEIEKQNLMVRSELLDLKTALLEKVIMSDERVQKTIFDIKLKELSIKKLQKDLELLDLERKKKAQEIELEELGKVGSDDKYALKNLQTLGESPDEEDEENGK